MVVRRVNDGARIIVGISRIDIASNDDDDDEDGNEDDEDEECDDARSNRGGDFEGVECVGEVLVLIHLELLGIEVLCMWGNTYSNVGIQKDELYNSALFTRRRHLRPSFTKPYCSACENTSSRN